MKPIKRGIKSSVHSDFYTEYRYDLSINARKDDSTASVGLLGERVIQRTSSTIHSSDMTLAFDRTFTTVHTVCTEDAELPQSGHVYVE